MCVCVCLPDAFLDRIALVSLVSSSVGLEAAVSVQSQRGEERRGDERRGEERRGEDDGDAEMGSLSPPKVKSRKWAPCQCGRTDRGPRSAWRAPGRGRSHHMTEQKGNSSTALTQSRSPSLNTPSSLLMVLFPLRRGTCFLAHEQAAVLACPGY